MRTAAAILIALITTVVVGLLVSVTLGVLGFLRGDTGMLQQLFIAVAAPAAGAAVGMNAARRILKTRYSEDGLLYGFAAVAVTVGLGQLLFMSGVARHESWRPIDWVVIAGTPIGAIAGAFIGRATDSHPAQFPKNGAVPPN